MRRVVAAKVASVEDGMKVSQDQTLLVFASTTVAGTMCSASSLAVHSEPTQIVA